MICLSEALDFVQGKPARLLFDIKPRTRLGRRRPASEQEWRRLHARMISSCAQGLITDRPDLISDQ